MSSRYNPGSLKGKSIPSPNRRQQSQVSTNSASSTSVSITEQQRQEIYEAFSLFDLNNDGFLDYHEMKVSFRALGFELTKKELLSILDTFGEQQENSKKLIKYDDFYRVAATKILERDPIEELKRAFALFDEDGDGLITFDNLKKVVEELGEDIADEDIYKMIDEFDLDDDGGINEQEFIDICTE
ncbi:hypothetical protein ACO0SA_000123 [Hanseniaspora valbyensis]